MNGNISFNIIIYKKNINGNYSNSNSSNNNDNNNKNNDIIKTYM